MPPSASPALPALHLPLSGAGPSNDGAAAPRAALAVAEFSSVNFGRFTCHFAAVCVAEMAVAEYCHSIVGALAVGVEEWDQDRSLNELDLLALEIQQTAARFGRIAAQIAARYGGGDVADDFLRRWKAIETTILRIQEHDGPNATSAATARGFLKKYLRDRGLPEDTQPETSRLAIYNEYFDRPENYATSSSYAKLVLAFPAAGAVAGAAVGAVMLDDKPIVRQWWKMTSKGDSLPRWQMQGVVGCPFYAATKRGGVGGSLLSHIESRVMSDPNVESIVVAVHTNAPDFWKQRLARSPVVVCSGCDVLRTVKRKRAAGV